MIKDKIFSYLMTKTWFCNRIKQFFTGELDYIQFNSSSEGCGLEDNNIEDIYESMEYGWNRHNQAVKEVIHNIG